MMSGHGSTPAGFPVDAGRPLAPLRLTWDGDRAHALLVTGPSALQPDGLAVVPAGALAAPTAIVPMAGRWDRVGTGLRFTPRLPFARGITYALVRSGSDTGAPEWIEVARVRCPAGGGVPTASVLAIHPEAAEVPENLLRVSITFSAPMEEGSAAGRVRLEDAAGQEIPQALLPMPPELWDRPRRRLTLLLEPGRIKRGLVPNTALGAPLAEHAVFGMVVDSAVRDATGAALIAGARRDYRVGPPIRERVDPARWDVSWPVPGSADELVVVLDRPLDHALALRCITVTDAAGRAVAGHAVVDQDDRRWTFHPQAVWPHDLELHVDAALEDLAGNSVRRVFDRDLRRPADAPLDLDEVVLTPDHPARAAHRVRRAPGGGRTDPDPAPGRGPRRA